MPAGKPVTTNIFPFQYAFNLFSHNSSLTGNGYNEEECKLVGHACAVCTASVPLVALLALLCTACSQHL